MRFSFSLLLFCAVRFEKNGKEQITKNLTKRKKTLKKTFCFLFQHLPAFILNCPPLFLLPQPLPLLHFGSPLAL